MEAGGWLDERTERLLAGHDLEGILALGKPQGKVLVRNCDALLRQRCDAGFPPAHS